MTTHGGYSVTQHKEMPGNEGYVMRGTLLHDGVPVGTYFDDGNGGEMQIDFANPVKAHTYRAYVASLPPEPFEGMILHVSTGMFICSLVEDFLNAKRIARLLKTNVLFRLPADKDGVMRTVKHGGKVDEARAHVLTKYPGATLITK